MRIRTYLILSYLGIVLLFTFGTLILAGWIVETMAEGNLRATEEAIKCLTAGNLQLSEKLLTLYGTKIVAMKADEVADRLSHRLGGHTSYDYKVLRKDEQLRRIATQDISAYKRESAGYVDVYDRRGLSIWHPSNDIEGKNFGEWKHEFPEMWKLVERSFVEETVAGYYDFFDKNGSRRKKYMVLVHSPQTPFIVASTVNIDEFFQPVHDEIENQSYRATLEARQSIETSSKSTRYKLKLVTIAGSLLLLGVGGISALWFATSVSRPVMTLGDAVGKMGDGNFTAEVPEQGAVEVRRLGKIFNELGKQLTEYIEKRDFIRDTFGRYLPQEVVAQLLESQDGLELGGETREITMIMSDIRGFTALIADIQPQQVISFLNGYLGKMVDIIHSNGGIVDEIIGDGIFAFFGAPKPLDDHPARAVACALQMQSAMEEVNGLNALNGFPPIEMGIAVHSGSVFVGNIGSEKRTKYGAVGANVNLTGRMESCAVGGQVLVSHSTYTKISQMLEVADVTEIQMKGISQTTTLYDVTGISDPYNIHLTPSLDDLIPVASKIDVRLHTLERKAVAGTTRVASITHFSNKRFLILSEHPLFKWEEVKIEFLEDRFVPMPEELYAKIISVSHVAGKCEALAQFTRIPVELLRELEQATNA
jgi:class 3 adenylate cyclase